MHELEDMEFADVTSGLILLPLEMEKERVRLAWEVGC